MSTKYTRITVSPDIGGALQVGVKAPFVVNLSKSISGVTIEELTKVSSEVRKDALSASNSAKAAKVSETNAKSSADSSAKSALGAKSSADAAKTSETNAKASETSAKGQVSEATNQAKLSKEQAVEATRQANISTIKATEAEASAITAGKSEINAGSSADSASNSANLAEQSSQNAKSSASAAKTSETNAKTSETAAAASQTAAKTYETNAKTSETNAKASEVAAKISETNTMNALALKFDKTSVVQTTGSSTTNVMSQKAITDALRGSELIQSANQIIRDTGGNVSDFNNAKGNAVFFGYPSALNSAGVGGVGIDIAQFNNSYRLQLASSFNGKVIAFRTKNGDIHTWNAWSRLYSTGNTTTDSNGFLRTGSATALTTGQVVQTTGSSTTNVMSQKAVTDLIGSRAIGIGQTWQNMSNSRRNMTNYTNTTDRPIFVYIKFLGGASSAENAVTVDGINVGFVSGAGKGVPNTIIVPPGSVYRVNTDRVVNTWSELR